jgi:hypothetical protein
VNGVGTSITNPALRSQVKIVIWGIMIAVGLYVASFIIPTILSFKFPPGLREILVLVALVVGPGSIAWAIMKERRALSPNPTPAHTAITT